MNLSDKIISYANETGIEVTGITGGEPLYRLESYLEEREEEGQVVPFTNSPAAERINPQLSLPGCQSIICLALPYYRPAVSPPDNNGPYGRVARIARCRDYHLLLREKAQQIISFLSDISSRSFRYRIFADNGPLIERAFACKTGGITGENTFFISETYGSWVALGLILLDIPLPRRPENQKGHEGCRSCGICRDNCPTGALSSPNRLNAKQCLSFICQNKGIVPLRYRDLLETRIYGCDDCQEVCPHNKDVPVSPLKEIRSPLIPDQIPLIPFLNINKDEFLNTIGSTAAGWRGPETLHRNTVIALGNSRDESAVDPLIKLLKNDSRPLIRLHAAWSLGKLGGLKARQALDYSFLHEKDGPVRREILAALNRL